MSSDQYSFLQNDSTIAERLKNVYEKDFTIYFSSCSKKLKVNRILADLISPRIFKNHYTEGSNKEYQLNRNSEEIDFNILSFIFKNLKIPTKKEIEEIEESKEKKENNINDDKNNRKKEERNQQEKEKDFLIKLLKFFKELGNEEVVKYFFEKEFKNKEMNKELFKEIIEIELSINETQFEDDEKEKKEDKEYSIYKIIEYEEIKKYGANHFEEVKEIIKKYLSKNEIKEIIEEESFKIDEEYNLMKFIKEIISERGEEFKEMISYIKYENLTVKEFEEYLEMIEPQEIKTEEWQKLIKKVMKFINKSKDNKLSPQNKAVFEIYPTKGKEFEGIFDHMNKECNGNCATKQIINVTSSSQYGRKEEFLFDYSTLKNNQYWTLNNELNGYLQIDFKDKRINLTHYSFQAVGSQTPKTWTIEGSNDLNSWDIVDSRKDDEFLKSGNELYHCYECSKQSKETYRYIRIYQRGCNHFQGNDYYFLLTGLEFFGKLCLVNQ